MQKSLSVKCVLSTYTPLATSPPFSSDLFSFFFVFLSFFILSFGFFFIRLLCLICFVYFWIYLTRNHFSQFVGQQHQRLNLVFVLYISFVLLLYSKTFILSFPFFSHCLLVLSQTGRESCTLRAKKQDSLSDSNSIYFCQSCKLQVSFPSLQETTFRWVR